MLRIGFRHFAALLVVVSLTACSGGNTRNVLPIAPIASSNSSELMALLRASHAAPVFALPAHGQRLAATYGVPVTKAALAVIDAKTGRSTKSVSLNETTRFLTLKRSRAISSLRKETSSRRASSYEYSCTVTVYGWLWPDGAWTYDRSDYSCMEYYFPDTADTGGGGGTACDTGAIYVAVSDDAQRLAQQVLSKLAGGGASNDPQRQADISSSDKIPVAESHFFNHASQILQNPNLDATQTSLMRGIARLMVASGTREAGYVAENGVSRMFVTPTRIWVDNFPGTFASNLPAYFVTFQNVSTGRLTTLFATSTNNLSRVIQSFLNKQVGYDPLDPDAAGDESIMSAAADDGAFADKPPVCIG